MTVEVSVLEGFRREPALRKRWIKMWDTLGERILKMPEYMQNIILEDIYTAVKNRIAIMEIIQNAK